MSDNKQPILNVETELPPMIHNEAPPTAGSAAPSDDVVMPAIVTTGPNLPAQAGKKFAGGKFIATILGLFLLVGGVGAGVFLVGQNQNINEKASCYSTCMNQVGDPDECDFVCSKPKTEKPTSVEKPTNKWEDDCACGVNAAGTACKKCEKEPEQGGKCGYCDDNSNCVSCAGGRISVGECSSNSQCAPLATPTPQQGGKCGYCDDNSNCVSCAGGRISVGECSSNSQCTGATVSSCPAPNKIVSGKCIPYGNCQSNTGNCYVKTKIGVGETDKQVCDGPHWTTCAEGYVCSNEDCIPIGNKTTKPSDNQTTTTTTTTSSTAQCQNIKAYSPTWALLTNTQLSALTAGSQVNFCVAGSASDGTFDKARLTINGALQAETSTIRPSSTDFCQLYVIPAGVTTFNVTAQIHHITLGWK